MPRFGITGHVNLSRGSEPVIYAALLNAIRSNVGDAGDGLIGVSCLAPGADAIFAQAILDLGGHLEVILPARDYRAQLRPDDVRRFDELLRHANVPPTTLPFAHSGRDAYEAANRALIGSSLDRLFAVWDGRVDTRKGNTASVVARAKTERVPVEIVWPAGVEREPDE